MRLVAQQYSLLSFIPFFMNNFISQHKFILLLCIFKVFNPPPLHTFLHNVETPSICHTLILLVFHHVYFMGYTLFFTCISCSTVLQLSLSAPTTSHFVTTLFPFVLRFSDVLSHVFLFL